MAYLGSPPASQFFAPGTDTFSGTGSQTAFTLSRNVATVNDIQVVVNNVEQQPSNYTVLNNILTFSPAPSAGTNNIYVRYLSTNLQSIVPQQGSVIPASLSTPNALYWDTSGNVGIGTTTPAQKLDVAGPIKSTGYFLGNTGTSGFAALGTTGTATDGGNLVGRSATSTYNTGGIELYTGGSERMRIDSAGNVGIGTTTPDSVSNFKFIDVGSSGTNQGVVQANNGTVKTAIYSSGVEGYVATRTNHTLNFQTNGNNQASITTAGLFQFNSGYGSVATAYGCRAWVNFNGTGTVAIRASGNVSSITDNGTGDYTVNFTTAMPDVNYSACVSTDTWAARIVSTATNSVRVADFVTTTAAAVDTTMQAVAIFR